MSAHPLIDGITQLLLTCDQLGLKPPRYIELESWDEGQVLLATLPEPSPFKHRWKQRANGAYWWELEIVTVTITWPAKKVAGKNGQTKLI